MFLPVRVKEHDSRQPVQATSQLSLAGSLGKLVVRAAPLLLSPNEIYRERVPHGQHSIICSISSAMLDSVLWRRSLVGPSDRLLATNP